MPPGITRRGACSISAVPIRGIVTDADIARCYDVMAEPRPHISGEEFVPRMRRQLMESGGGYRLAFVVDSGAVVCVAGFRYRENLVYGRNQCVDDLVSLPG